MLMVALNLVFVGLCQLNVFFFCGGGNTSLCKKKKNQVNVNLTLIINNHILVCAKDEADCYLTVVYFSSPI